MPHDEVAVLRGDEVRLHEFGTELDRQGVVLQGVIGQVPRGAPAVAEDDRNGFTASSRPFLGGGGRGQKRCGDQGGGPDHLTCAHNAPLVPMNHPRQGTLTPVMAMFFTSARTVPKELVA